MKSKGIVSKVLVLSLTFFATSFLMQPAYAEDAPKTSLDICKAAKSVIHNPMKIPVQKNVSAKLPSTMTIVTNCGNIEIALASQLAPVTISKLAHLAKNKFFDNSLCHRLTTSGIYVVQCGDPSGTGSGGPAYTAPDENLPTGVGNIYPAGTVAMANSGPGTNGSQFFIVYQDNSRLGPNYTLWGRIVKGLDIVKAIAAAGSDNSRGPGDGRPIQAIAIERAISR